MWRTDDKYKPIKGFEEEKVIYLFSKYGNVNEFCFMKALSTMAG